jgi:hypothetical protein
MGVDVLRNKAEEYLEKARAISDRQRARLLLVQAHNYLQLVVMLAICVNCASVVSTASILFLIDRR